MFPNMYQKFYIYHICCLCIHITLLVKLRTASVLISLFFLCRFTLVLCWNNEVLLGSSVQKCIYQFSNGKCILDPGKLGKAFCSSLKAGEEKRRNFSCSGAELLLKQQKALSSQQRLSPLPPAEARCQMSSPISLMGRIWPRSFERWYKHGEINRQVSTDFSWVLRPTQICESLDVNCLGVIPWVLKAGVNID